jgi:hypothetical protein
MYPSQHFPLRAAFVCQAGKLWTLQRIHIRVYTCIYIYIGFLDSSGGCFTFNAFLEGVREMTEHTLLITPPQRHQIQGL